MLNLIGIGLSHKNITEEIIDLVKDSNLIYLENYTSKYDITKEGLENLFGKSIISADRKLVENTNEIIKNSEDKIVSFLVIGDIFSATTHIDLLLEAKKKNISVKVIHNVSILTAVGETGLFLYNFGKITSIPFDNKNVKEPLMVLEMNRRNGLHTLFLLDLDPKNEKYMTINEALSFLNLDDNTLAVGCCALGTRNSEIKSGSVKELKEYDFVNFPQCLIVPGRMHFIEEETLELYRF